jgi:hypothetical protein
MPQGWFHRRGHLNEGFPIKAARKNVFSVAAILPDVADKDRFSNYYDHNGTASLNNTPDLCGARAAESRRIFIVWGPAKRRDKP